MKRLSWKWMDFNERRKGNSPWIAENYCPERTLFPMAPEQTWKEHISWGIVGAGLNMAAWAWIELFMEGFKSFHFWEHYLWAFYRHWSSNWDKVTWPYGEQLPELGKWILISTNEPVPYCLISAILHMGQLGSWFSCTSFQKLYCTETVIIHKNSRACLSFVAGNRLHIAPYRVHSSQGHAEEQTDFGHTCWCPDKLTTVSGWFSSGDSLMCYSCDSAGNPS